MGDHGNPYRAAETRPPNYQQTVGIAPHPLTKKGLCVTDCSIKKEINKTFTKRLDYGLAQAWQYFIAWIHESDRHEFKPGFSHL